MRPRFPAVNGVFSRGVNKPREGDRVREGAGEESGNVGWGERGGRNRGGERRGEREGRKKRPFRLVGWSRLARTPTNNMYRAAA